MNNSQKPLEYHSALLKPSKPTTSVTAVLLLIISIVICIFGFLGGLTYIDTSGELCFVIWASSAVMASITAGISKAIRLLCEINDKIK